MQALLAQLLPPTPPPAPAPAAVAGASGGDKGLREGAGLAATLLRGMLASVKVAGTRTHTPWCITDSGWCKEGLM